MGKRKRKKEKHTNNKKRKLYSPVSIIDNSYGKGIKQRDLQQEIQEQNKDNDFEQRRANRLGAVVAVIAVIGTICLFTFKLLVAVLDIWPNEGVIYWYFPILISSVISALIIIFYRVLMFVINDLQRHNVAKENYQEYDKKSDDSYNLLVNDFKVYMVLLTAVSSFLVPLFNWNNKTGEKTFSIIVIVLIIIFCIYYIFHYLKKHKKDILLLGEKMLWWIVVGFFIYVMAFLFLLINKAIIEVHYQENGEIEISNTSSESFYNFKIAIYDNNEVIIYEESIEQEKLLWAKENKYVSDNIGTEGILIKSEFLHWKYFCNISDIIDKEGKYYITLIVEQNGKRVELKNSFIMEQEKFIYAKNAITKEY